eukprot:TRINITY_DN5580_c0_g2_i1.p1 TRINITY_DN5580_c0_g2~~TRINITY_DN5580_c0_g2_i1.p1  ORF type:complete len:431 (+),score=65.56 TRINITY_DN5580_c0_g2_i1:77-1294(+)
MVRRTTRQRQWRQQQQQPQQQEQSQQPKFTDPQTARLKKLPFIPVSRVQREGSLNSTSAGSDLGSYSMHLASDELSSSTSSDGLLSPVQGAFVLPHPPGLLPPWKLQASPAQARPREPSFLMPGASHRTSSSPSLREEVNEALALGNIASFVKRYSHKSVETVKALLSLLDEMQYPLSIDEYNVLLHASSQVGDVETSERCMEEIEEKNITPNLITYNSIINACAVCGDTACAIKWLDRLEVAGFQPNDVTFGTICKAFSRRGDVAAIKAIIDALEGQGLPPNEYYYASLISACGNQEPANVIMAEHAFLRLVEHGLRVQSVKKALVRVVGEQRATELLEQTSARVGGGDDSQVSREFGTTTESAKASRSEPTTSWMKHGASKTPAKMHVHWSRRFHGPGVRALS